MDYSKTHYYKYTAPNTTNQTRSTIPVFEADFVPAAPDEGPVELPTPSLDANTGSSDFVPAAPDEGPVELPTPALPSTPPVVTYPPVGGGSTTPSRPNTNTGNNIFWSYTWLSPIFSNMNMSAVAQARFYNVSAMVEPIDIYINGQLIVSDLDYTEYTDFFYIIPGYYNVTIYRRSNPRYPFFSTRVSFVRNTICTVSFVGTIDNPGLQFIC